MSRISTPSTAPGRQRLGMWVSLWGIFVTNVTLTILTIALPEIARDMDADPAVANWVTLGPMLVVSLLTPAAGRAADDYGRKRLWVGGFSLAIVGMAGSGLAPTLGTLLACRILTGMGTAAMVPAGLAIATQEFPPEERATPVGYWTGTVALSPMLGILLGGWVVEHISWRWLFAGQVALALPCLAVAVWVIQEHRSPAQGRFDWAGALHIGGASLALMLAATWWPSHGLFDLRTLGALAAALALGVRAVGVERRATNPVLPPHVMADPQIATGVVVRLALNSVYMGAFITLPYLLTEVWHMAPFAVSTLLLPRPLAMGVTGPLVGRLSQRFSAARLVVVGALGIFVSTGMYAALSAQPTPAFLITALVIAGISLALCVSGTAAIATARVPIHELGTIAGLMALTATLANVLGMAVVFACVETFGGAQDPLAYRKAFLAALCVAAVGVGAALRLWMLARAQTVDTASAT